MRTGMMKPKGKLTPSVCEDVLLLIGETPPSDPKTWTESQLAIAYDYAIRIHLRASDNRGVRLHPRPRFLGGKP